VNENKDGSKGQLPSETSPVAGSSNASPAVPPGGASKGDRVSRDSAQTVAPDVKPVEPGKAMMSEGSDRHSPLLRESMLGLLYPAVLGSIAYSGLAAVFKTLLPLVVKRQAPWTVAFDPSTALRAVLYVLTFAFYCCDYYYLRFTNTYRKLFFTFDCIFIVGLYLTAALIDWPELNGVPDLRSIVVLYAIFMALYFCWDWIERAASKRQGQGEEKLYRWVLCWEALSLLILIVTWLLASQTLRGGVFVCLALALITTGFVFVDIEKKNHCKSLPLANKIPPTQSPPHP
jgi:hypothetical protein